jgi:hypothetical protein
VLQVNGAIQGIILALLVPQVVIWTILVLMTSCMTASTDAKFVKQVSTAIFPRDYVQIALLGLSTLTLE